MRLLRLIRFGAVVAFAVGWATREGVARSAAGRREGPFDCRSQFQFPPLESAHSS